MDLTIHGKKYDESTGGAEKMKYLLFSSSQIFIDRSAAILKRTNASLIHSSPKSKKTVHRMFRIDNPSH